MPLNINLQQILLHLFNFAILAGGLYFLLYKPVKDFMGHREEEYKAREAEIQKAKEDALALRHSYEEKIRQADDEIHQMHTRASDEMEAERQKMISEARGHARRILETANKTAELRTRKALDDSSREIRSMAIDAVEKLMLTGDNALDKFLEEAEHISAREEIPTSADNIAGGDSA